MLFHGVGNRERSAAWAEAARHYELCLTWLDAVEHADQTAAQLHFALGRCVRNGSHFVAPQRPRRDLIKQ